jgi:hypothetical protein
MGNHTPFEAWMGRKPHLAHVRVFGCTTHMKTPTHLKKLMTGAINSSISVLKKEVMLIIYMIHGIVKSM